MYLLTFCHDGTVTGGTNGHLMQANTNYPGDFWFCASGYAACITTEGTLNNYGGTYALRVNVTGSCTAAVPSPASALGSWLSFLLNLA